MQEKLEHLKQVINKTICKDCQQFGLCESCSLKITIAEAKERDKILALVEKFPDELGMVLQCKTYEEYLDTFYNIGLTKKDVAYTESEYNKLRKHFNYAIEK